MKYVNFMSSVIVGFIAVVFLLFVFSGVVGVIGPALGYFPVLGYSELQGDAWDRLLATPSLVPMLGLSLWVGVLSTFLSLLLAFGTVTVLWGTPRWQTISRWLSPFLATPHVALAFGFSFLIIPSGLLVRLLVLFTGWEYPPDWHTAQDPFALSLVVLLVLKETPFLVFMMMAALERLPVKPILNVGQSLGYQLWACWMKLIWPQLYSLIRLPVFTVLAFSISVVDIALVLGPTNPPLFSVQVFQWLQSPDLSMQLPAAAGSLLLAMLIILAILSFYLMEKIIRRYGTTLVIQWSPGPAGKSSDL